MRKLLFVLLLSYSLVNTLWGQAACDNSLWQHVYNPSRFTVWKRCTTVTGVIKAMKKEPDGDFHIQLLLDPGQPRFLNQRNIDAQNGCLVLEIICYNKVKQPDAVDACNNCPENVTIPRIGDHVQVTGSFVKDLEANHGWNEIHPVSQIVPAS
ncbi:MAG TPA: hypothetical protein VNV35_00135 [Puia sp.]|nr:hypothetical protein [Puia sp.]